MIIKLVKLSNESTFEYEVIPPDTLVLDITHAEITLRDVYSGVGIETDQGRFGIAMRDDGIEVVLNGELVWSSTMALGNA